MPLLIDGVLFCSGGGDFVALDLNGNEVWRDRLEPPVGSSPAGARRAGFRADRVIEDGRVFMWNTQGESAGYDVRARRILWRKPGYLGAGMWRGQLMMSQVGAVEMWSGLDGVVTERIAIGDARPGTAVIEDTLVVAYEEGGVPGLRAVNLPTLETIWDNPAPEVLGSRDTSVSNLLVGTRTDMFMWYGSAGGKAVLAGHTLKDGSLMWAAEGVSFPHGPFVHEGKIPILSKEFRIFDENTGKLLATGVNHGTIYEKQGCVVKNMVVFTDEFGRIVCYDLTTGENLGRDRVMEDRRKRQGGSFYGSMSVGDRVYIPDGWGNIWIYRAP